MKIKITSATTLFLLLLSGVSCKKDKITPVDVINEESNLSSSAILNHGLGAKETPRYLYESFPVYVLNENSKALQPLTYTQNHPPVGDQGASETCAAWAIGYAGRSIAYKSSHPSSTWSNTTNVFSPAYVYNSLNNGSCSTGLYASDIFNLFKNRGICTWSKKPFIVGQCTPIPTAQMNLNAANYKIANHSWGTIPFPGNSTSLTQCVNAIKANLLAGNTVLVSFKVDHNYDYLASGKILSKFDSHSVRGQHFNTIVGYNQTKKYFILQNSWGTSWATQGMAYVSYDMITSGAWNELYYMNKQ